MIGKLRFVTSSALTLAALSALLLSAARPVQAQTESVLHNFTGDSDGGNPYAGLTSDAAGNFYGTTPSGGLRDDYNLEVAQGAIQFSGFEQCFSTKQIRYSQVRASEPGQR